MMKRIIDDNDLELVAGGRYYLNRNNNKLCFENVKEIYQLQNCTPYQAMDLMDSLIGKYDNQAQYDAACAAALKSKGWVTVIGHF